MKRLVSIFLVFSVVGLLPACQKAEQPQPAFPLKEEVVTAALEQTGLPGKICKSETQSYRKGHVLYTVRNQPEPLPMVAVSSALTEGERYLSLIFISPPVSEQIPFTWDDWKQQLLFTALLCGSFSDEEELYRAFSQQTAAEGEIPSADKTQRLEWFAQLPAGYCRVRYNLAESSIESSSLGTIVLAWSPRLYVTIYESKSLYDKMELERKKALERVQEQKRKSE